MGLFGCASAPPAQRWADDPSLAQRAAVVGPYLEARTEFTIVLDRAVGATSSVNPQKWTAHVESPVRSLSNEIVIQTQALVHFEVIAAERSRAPIVNLKFDDVETIWGPSALSATVRSAGPDIWVSSIGSCDRGVVGYDAALGAVPKSEPFTNAGAIGGGPSPGKDDESPVILPTGTRLRLALREPLVPPARR
ncbi:MAG TPA: hypothetical protein VJT73_08425 [Polyangiaceae bacterium]|nr:hypothetical protein [Polyangiaceae bacterium]